MAGPFHSAFRELVESRIYFEDIMDSVKDKKDIVVAVNPAEISKVIGNKKCNVEKFREIGIKISVKADKRIKKGNFKRKLQDRVDLRKLPYCLQLAQLGQWA